MQTLSRQFNQVIRISDDISITVLRFDDGKVTIGVQAPRETPVIRCKITDYRLPKSEPVGPVKPHLTSLPERYRSQRCFEPGPVSQQLLAMKRREKRRPELKLVRPDEGGEFR